MTNHILANIRQLLDPARKIKDWRLKDVDFR